jgi:protein gp37
MAQETNISWTQATYNPWHGCLKVSPGCKNCYMYRDKQRFGQDPKMITRSKAGFHAPLKWKDPRLIFTCSWSDWFIEEADDWRDEAWDVIRQTPHHTYQILTKRPERILEHLPKDWGDGWKNVWLGVSVESQKYVERVAILQRVPAHVRFISAEPLLENVVLPLSGIHWVITGGESGPGAREFDPSWARFIRTECAARGIAFFHKQNGGTQKIDGVWGGDKLFGKVYQEMPKV